MCIRDRNVRRPELAWVCRFISPHRGSAPNDHDDDDDTYLMMRPVYTTEYAESVRPKHKVPEKVRLLHYCGCEVCLSPRKGTGHDQRYFCGIGRAVSAFAHHASCLEDWQCFHKVQRMVAA